MLERVSNIHDLYHISKDGRQISGPNARMTGDCSGIFGGCSGLTGDCSGIFGNLDSCGITDADRTTGVEIDTLVDVGSETERR